jgi:homogentisate phytyltransferase/homogentisate geranylgeranyltransferase
MAKGNSQEQQASRSPAQLGPWLRAFVRFTRPHTITGTSASVLGLYLIALAYNHFPPTPWARLLLTLLCTLGANVYIVGLNQITDVAIDRLNKPYLPLASGAFTRRTAWTLVLGSLLLSLLLALWLGPYLLITVLVSTLIGSAYSLPPLRLKRFHFWAAASIFSVRGVVVNLFLFLHFDTMLGGAAQIPAHIWALTAFVVGLSLVIAWFKDIPDMKGDDRFHIATLSLRLGPQRVFNLGLLLLALCYLGLILAGVLGLPHVNRPLFVLLHLLPALLLWWRGHKVDPRDASAVAGFYLFIWALFYAEYLLFAIAALLA